MQILKIIALLIEYPDETLWENREEALSLVEQDAPMLLPFARQHLGAVLLDKQAEWCEVFERGHAVVVLPYDARQDKVVLIEQVRFPALATTKSPWLLELVAGMIAPEETPMDVAHRELMEETGLVAKQMHCVNSYLASPGGSTERFYFYWADVDSNDARGLHGLAEEHEDIRLHVPQSIFRNQEASPMLYFNVITRIADCVTLSAKAESAAAFAFKPSKTC